MKSGLSAGRVQSVAVKLIIDREQEISDFVPEEYWTVEVTLVKDGITFIAHFHGFGKGKTKLSSQADVDKLLAAIKDHPFVVSRVTESERKRRPSPPFITSSLQQEAARKLGFRANKSMRIAQQLYEGIECGSKGSVGLITYMRTDSLRVSPVAQAETKEYITTKYGPKYIPEKQPVYKRGKNTQDAHEAIRPTTVRLDPESIKQFLSRDQYRLYTLIWRRFVASQMAPALFDMISVDINAGTALFRATGSKMKFDGFMKIYTEVDQEEPKDSRLPPLEEGQTLKQKETLPNNTLRSHHRDIMRPA